MNYCFFVFVENVIICLEVDLSKYGIEKYKMKKEIAANCAIDFVDNFFFIEIQEEGIRFRRSEKSDESTNNGYSNISYQERNMALRFNQSEDVNWHVILDEIEC